MKRILLTAVILMIAVTGFLSAQNEADEAYIKAMTQSDPCQKVQALKAYIAKYAGKGTQYENFAYVYLCLTQCASKPLAETNQYGEKALTMSGVDDLNKSTILATMAQLNINAGQNLDKAKAYAGQLIALGKANQAKDPADAQWGKLVGAGHYLQGQAAEKAKDMGGAAESYIAAYSILKNPQIMAQIKKLAKTLYDAKQFGEAEQVFRTLYNQSKDSESALILGQTLYKNNKPDEALALFKEAYAKKRTGELAYNIGIILAKKSPQEAIDYLLEASFLYPAQSSQALGMAQGIFFGSSSDSKFNDTIKQIQEKTKKIDDLTKTFNTKFVDKNEEDLTDAEKAEMQKILADIDVQKKEIAKLQSASSDMTTKWTKRMEDVKKRLGSN
ncbi:MAG: tetratricopeptide repeat protein [Candidatus Aminicenantales bacterium]